ncbi:HNH endonuclease [Tenacibaculum finnmarkense genomovar finnmarkense]|uniref:HNH endonuclease n=1 Tax=Tenacibaculum finnmarkense TaxID=2781243 RepID=UPI001EFB54A5|nr:HNH endonuclease [Tenacibaculum finnmarkense]MCG8201049.1 HNH endonuclease [Tenacibaculum finnmarkense genomovar finnmarkense]MCG8209077.1 HNH endonuclease [Tenacibaculum finnmarkense genomovar finnmarkense]MCG8211607.1 HNH endonuclease [Tenacibaculum finnmarkense genomovar finnmarkense]MCG8218923.1 HNH endonuclease [Tenacibaculum finnmarkense genomovar finnmarkense]MCG8221347.1 HNH endonuclease [Tenacibaculum finnmarkense genomovar finnmarkense]
MKKIIIALILIASSSVFSQNSKVKIIKVAAKIISKKTINQVPKTYLNTFKFTSKEIITKTSHSLSPSETKKFLRRTFSEKKSKVIYNKLGNKKLNRIHNLLPKDSPKEVRKVFISDFEKSPKLIAYYEKHNLLNCCYAKIIGMGGGYRRDLAFIKQIKKGISPIKIKTINQDKVGKIINGVPFRRRVKTLPNGLKVEGIFPDFKKHSIFEVIIPNHNMLKTDNSQFNLAFLKLQSSLKRSPDLQKKLPKSVIDEILSRKLSISKSNNRVKGYVWHHTENSTLQFIKSETHDAVRHTGGRALFGAGSTLR